MSKKSKKVSLIILCIAVIFSVVIILFLNQPKGKGMEYSETESYMIEDLQDESLYVYSEWSNDKYLIKSFISNNEDWGYYLFVNDKNTWVHENTYNLKNGADKNYIVTSEKSTDIPLWVVLVNNGDKYETIYSVVESVNHNGESVTERTEKIDLETQYSMVVFENKENYQNYDIYFDLGNDDILVP